LSELDLLPHNSNEPSNEPSLVLQLTPIGWENQQKSTSRVNRSMDELDQRLQELALAAKNFPAKSRARRKALTKLINEVQNSNKIFCRGRFDFPPEVYNEALQETWLYICQNIENCDPSIGRVMTWINFILERRFINVINRRARQGQQQSLDEPIRQNDSEGDFQRTLLDRIEETNFYTRSPEWENLRSLIEEDPDGKFQLKYIEGNPSANFQAIAIKRLNEESWKDISLFFQIPVPTLSTFYQRCIKHFTPLFLEYL
jgi:DNA-directed RNA polymerase specialized sigma24 family protein